MLAQAYHWTLDDIKKLSYVQVLLLQHAASHNRKLLDKRLEEGRKKGTLSPSDEMAEGGRKITEMSSDEIMMLAGTESGRGPKVIKLRKDDDAPTPQEQGE